MEVLLSAEWIQGFKDLSLMLDVLQLVCLPEGRRSVVHLSAWLPLPVSAGSTVILHGRPDGDEKEDLNPWPHQRSGWVIFQWDVHRTITYIDKNDLVLNIIKPKKSNLSQMLIWWLCGQHEQSCGRKTCSVSIFWDKPRPEHALFQRVRGCPHPQGHSQLGSTTGEHNNGTMADTSAVTVDSSDLLTSTTIFPSSRIEIPLLLSELG